MILQIITFTVMKLSAVTIFSRVAFAVMNCPPLMLMLHCMCSLLFCGGRCLTTSPFPLSFRRLDPSERPLQILYDYLAAMGYADPVRVQHEAANSDLSCLIRFYKHPVNADQQERTLLKGVFSVRKGKTQLHKWAERQVILCGTCLIVASVKDSLTGKMHILPLVGGKVEEVKRRQHCLMFSSAGSQAQTYFVNFDTLADFQRWHRQASKVVSQTVSMVDLSCYSLEAVPEYLFYSQDITHLNLRHNFMSLQGPGGLLNLPRFSQLKSLNLSHNRLGVFPECVCEILTLTELNLSCNNLHTVPVQIGNLQSLQTLSLDGNHLSSLPEELGGLSQLNCLGLSFNNFSHIPAVLERLSAVDKLAMAGNRVESLELCTLARMSHLKNIDLRLNGLRWVKSESLEAVSQVTQLDLRDNCLDSLDLSSICNLETLQCQRNQLGTLTLSGFTLRMLHASSNRLTTVNIYPVPNQLTHMELSQNLLEYLPDWVCDCRKIEMLDVTHNLLSELPSRCFLSLRKLLAGNNRLQRVPDLLDHVPLEALDLQHNKLTELPESLFYKALNLKYLNVSANTLESIPPSSQSEESLSTLQELYLTGNSLNENCGALLVGHQNLRVLHIAYNQLLSFPASKLSKLELLEELNLSGNKLKTIPSTVSSCKRLHTLIAHSNHINVFPEILSLPEIKLVDLSCNELTEIQLPDSLPATLQELDLTGNSSLMLEHKTLNLFSHITTLKLDQKSTTTAGDSLSASTPWNHGYSEMSGQRNKLCVSVLTVDRFGDGVEACYGIFDGDRNEEVPRLLQCTMGDVLCEELQHSSIDSVYMCNTFLTSHRKLGMAGQKLGASALLCYIHHEPSDPGGHLSLTVANVGTCQAVLCRDGRPVALSKVYSLENCTEEMERVKVSKAIITEDNKVSGVTCCSRLLGCSYLSPWVLPKPWVHTEPLCSQDEFLILGNRALFERVSYQEAVCTVQAVRDPRAAAKKLCSLAQSYGCKDNIGAVVVSLHIGEDSCTCEPPVSTAEPRGPPPAPVPVSVTPGPADPATLSSSSGGVSEFNSETSASEVGSEAGSTASDEHQSSGPTSRPERRCSLHPATTLCGIMVPGSGGAGTHPGLFQRQPSCATFSSNQSDNGLDSDDEAPLEGVISNGSKLEVEVDIHCCAFQLREITDLKKSPSTSSLFGKKLSNGSVVAPEDSHNLIEVALEAPKKKSGYFTAPAQQDPEDQLIVPPSLEQEVREQLRGQSPLVSGPSAPSTAPILKDPVWDHPHPPAFASSLVPGPGPAPILQQEVYDTAL
uniref:PH domain leucine-rich repeat-containing protein phosphatase 2 n=1 Tax=Lates calcarifer TaxID=8187 RepID=A0A4W6EDE3_LATCA